MTKTKRLTWRKDLRPTGLAGVGAGPMGHTLSYGGEKCGHVSPAYEGFSRRVVGWYWVAGWDIARVPYRNTGDTLVDTEEQAKWACEAYVRAHLGKPPPKRPRP